MNNIVDCKEIAILLNVASEKVARNICVSGKFKTAVKKGNSWTVNRSEVLRYREMKGDLRRNFKRLDEDTRQKILELVAKDTKSDLAIAREVGVSHRTVAKIKQDAGIKTEDWRKKRESKFDWNIYDHELGKKPDIELANEIGCVETTIKNRRKKLGIPPFSPVSP